MDAKQLQAWLTILVGAEQIGTTLVTEIKALMHTRLTPEENQQVLAQWEDNARRSAANAGLPPTV